MVQPLDGVNPNHRPVNMVFQSYAVFPHMTVVKNVAYGLKVTGVSRVEIARREPEALSLVKLDGFENRLPHQLSGGQQQRVALARALAPQPELVLMDEPFSNLDLELRERLTVEVREVLKEQGATAVLVTHDQHDAFALSDRVGVVNDGQILQFDTPYNLYHEPSNRFIANFIGDGVFLPGILLRPDAVETELGIVVGDRAYGWGSGTPIDVLIRPDDIVPDDTAPLSAVVVRKAFKGAEILYTLQLADDGRVLSLFPSHANHAVGERVGIRLEADHLVAFRREHAR